LVRAEKLVEFVRFCSLEQMKIQAFQRYCLEPLLQNDDMIRLPASFESIPAEFARYIVFLLVPRIGLKHACEHLNTIN
jgi:hypothetical protein